MYIVTLYNRTFLVYIQNGLCFYKLDKLKNNIEIHF